MDKNFLSPVYSRLKKSLDDYARIENDRIKYCCLAYVETCKTSNPKPHIKALSDEFLKLTDSMDMRERAWIIATTAALWESLQAVKALGAGNATELIHSLSMADKLDGRLEQMLTDKKVASKERSIKSKHAADQKNHKNRADKQAVIKHYLANKSKYRSKDEAAELIPDEISIHYSWKTVREWLKGI